MSFEIPTELRHLRSRTSKTFQTGAQTYRLVVGVGSLHVASDPAAHARGETVEWLDHDRTIRRVGNALTVDGWFRLTVKDGTVGYRFRSHLSGSLAQVTLTEIDGVPVSTFPAPRIDGNKLWWDDAAPGLSFYLVIGVEGVEMFKRLAGPTAPRMFTWEIVESLPIDVPVQTETVGWDNADNAEPTREGTGPQRRRRHIRMANRVTSEQTDGATRMRMRVLREEWTGQTVALDKDRIPSLSDDVAWPVLIDTVITVNIAADADDGQQTGTTTWANFSTATAHQVYNFSTTGNRPGYRFQNVTIPQGSTINSATLAIDFVSKTAGPSNGGITLFGNAVDNAPAWSTGAGPNNMTTTTASVAYPTFGTGAGLGAKSMNVAGIVQEIVNRAGWASGNAMALGCHGAFSGSSGSYTYIYDFHANNAANANTAILTVDYSASAPASASSSSSSSSSSASSAKASSVSASAAPSSVSASSRSVSSVSISPASVAPASSVSPSSVSPSSVSSSSSGPSPAIFSVVLSSPSSSSSSSSSSASSQASSLAASSAPSSSATPTSPSSVSPASVSPAPSVSPSSRSPSVGPVASSLQTSSGPAPPVSSVSLRPSSVPSVIPSSVSPFSPSSVSAGPQPVGVPVVITCEFESPQVVRLDFRMPVVVSAKLP